MMKPASNNPFGDASYFPAADHIVIDIIIVLNMAFTGRSI